MGSARGQYHHGDLQRALVDSAVRWVRAEGLETFSLRAIARSLDVDPAAAYRHFRDRDALLAAVSAAGFAELAAASESAMAAAAGSGGAAEEARFLALGRAYIAFALAEPRWFTLMFGPLGVGRANAAPAKGVGPSGRGSYDMLLESLGDLGLRGERGQLAALAAWSAVHGLASLLVGGAMRRDLAELATESTLRTVLKGLLAAEGGSPRAEPPKTL